MNTFLRLTRLLWIAALLLGTLTAPAPTAAQATQTCERPDRSVSTPLTDLGNNPYVRMDGTVTEFTGGLYPHGSNTRPPELEAATLSLAEQITPLNTEGLPDPAGKIILLSIGMSNVESEFNRFIHLAQDDPQINPNVVLLNGAISGRTAERWVDPQAGTWVEVNYRLLRGKLSPLQVQAAWVKQTLLGAGDFPAKTLELQSDLEAIARNLKQIFPNLKIAYFSSRTRSYAYPRGLSPEPQAFEGGFAVKWMIEKQLEGDPSLNYDPERGPVQAPLLVWGPYLWIDGTNPRSDGRTWLAEDMAQDCVHPSESGRTKVAEMLMEFFKTDTSTTSWFLAGGTSPAAQPTSTPPRAPATPTPSPTIALSSLDAATATPSSGPGTAPLAADTPLAPAQGSAATPTPFPVPATNTPPKGQLPGALLVMLGLGLLGAGFAAGWYVSVRRRSLP